MQKLWYSDTAKRFHNAVRNRIRFKYVYYFTEKHTNRCLVNRITMIPSVRIRGVL